MENDDKPKLWGCRRWDSKLLSLVTDPKWLEFPLASVVCFSLALTWVIQSLVTKVVFCSQKKKKGESELLQTATDLHSPWFNPAVCESLLNPIRAFGGNPLRLGKWWKSMAYYGISTTNILTWSKWCTPPANKISKKIWDDTGQITKMGTGSQKIELAIWAECLPLTIDRNRDMLY